MKEKLSEKIFFYFVEAFDSTILTYYYFIFGVLFSYTIDLVFPEFNKNMNKAIMVLQIFAEITVTLLAAALLFKMRKYIPIPFVNIFKGERGAELRSTLNSEIKGGIIITFSIYMFQENLVKKIRYIFGTYDGEAEQDPPG